MTVQLDMFAEHSQLKHSGLCEGCNLECRLRNEFEKSGLSLRVSLCATKRDAGIEPYRLVDIKEYK
jgi:hypothetical protein